MAGFRCTSISAHKQFQFRLELKQKYLTELRASAATSAGNTRLSRRFLFLYGTTASLISQVLHISADSIASRNTSPRIHNGSHMASDDRFYQLEFRHRSALRGDIGSLLRVEGLIVGGGGARALLLLPTTVPLVCRRQIELSTEEW